MYASFQTFLDKKFDKNQGCDAPAKNEFRYAKMPELASCLRLIKLVSALKQQAFLTLHYIHFLTLAEHQGRLVSHDNAAHDRCLPIITAGRRKAGMKCLLNKIYTFQIMVANRTSKGC